MKLTRRALQAQLLATVCAAASFRPALGQSLNYDLRPSNIGDGMWFLRGLDEHLTRQNGGNIANAVFISTGDGLLVFDTGPSRAYGEQLRQAIQLTTTEPVRQVMNSHAHPDHYLGNQAFAGVPIAGLQGTADTINEIGEVFTDNMYRLVDYWMKGTVTTPPNIAIGPGPVRIGKRQFEVLALDGHTSADLAIFDHESGTMITGDLVFMNRAPTTPQADLERWHKALDYLQSFPIRRLIPGHGPVTEGTVAIEQTRGYLIWLEDKLRAAADQGLAAAEVMELEIEPEFINLAEARDEFVRSVSHLYGQIQLDSLKRIN